MLAQTCNAYPTRKCLFIRCRRRAAGEAAFRWLGDSVRRNYSTHSGCDLPHRSGNRWHSASGLLNRVGVTVVAVCASCERPNDLPFTASRRRCQSKRK